MNKNTRLQIMMGKLLAVGIVFGTLLVGCGGGGGGPAATVGGVYISAGISPTSTAGMYSGVVSLYVDTPSGASIANAIVTINGLPLTYNPSLNYYGNNNISPSSGNFTLSVTANGATYTATQIPFPWTPTITVPPTFTAANSNSISWTAPSGVSGLNYDVRIDDFSNIVYTTPSTSAISISIPAGTTTATTSYTATVQAFQIGPQIANAATGSNFSYSASVTTPAFTAH